MKSKDKKPMKSNKQENFFYKIFSWQYTETIISLIFTVGIGLYAIFYEEKQKAVFWLVLAIIVIIFAALLGLSWYNKNLREKRQTETCEQQRITELETAKNEKQSKLENAKSINEHYIQLGNFLNNFLTGEIYYYKHYELTDKNGLLEEEYNGQTRYFVDYEKVDCFRTYWIEICERLCDLVEILGGGKTKELQCGVNIILMCDDGGEQGFYMPADAYTHMPNSRATIQNKCVSIKDYSKKKRYYKTLLDNNFDELKILPSKEKIKVEFGFEGDDNKNEFNQYIAIPLRYKNTTFGILQIIAYNESIIYTDDKISDTSERNKATVEKLMKWVNTYFSVYEKLVLLTFILGLKGE